jgi:sialate O-acetylesterase
MPDFREQLQAVDEVRGALARGEPNPPLPGGKPNNPNVCTVLYNGMIAPLTPLAVRGAIWYQGESNASRGRQYRTLLPILIEDWRARFTTRDFGFHIVSLANFMPVHPEPRESQWAELREAQAMTARSVRGAGLALAIDIGDAKDIHPRNKQEVGRRLALSALAKTYGRRVAWGGPWYRSMRVSGRDIVLSFDHTEGGLVAKDGPLKGFAIAGEDGRFVWADARIEGKKVRVSSPSVAAPRAVRYGWDANPVVNLFNGAGLPAVPFRTDVEPAKPAAK